MASRALTSGAPRFRLRGFRLLSALAVLAYCALGRASDLVPVPLRSAIIVRSAGYERTFAERSGVAVLTVVTAKSGAAAQDGREMLVVLGKLLADARIGSRKIRVLSVEHQTTAGTVEALKNQGAEIIYISRGLEEIVSSIPPKEGRVRRIVVCAWGGDVRLGCTLGVELDGDKPKLVLNLKQATAAGLRFDSSFLRLARIVR